MKRLLVILAIVSSAFLFTSCQDELPYQEGELVTVNGFPDIIMVVKTADACLCGGFSYEVKYTDKTGKFQEMKVDVEDITKYVEPSAAQAPASVPVQSDVYDPYESVQYETVQYD